MQRLLFILFTLGILNSPFFIASSHALDRFVDLNNGTILDTQSSLIWLKNADCFGLQNWDLAMTDASSLASGQCDLNDGSKAGDWHLPIIDELRIFDNTGYRPDTLNAAGFSGVQAGYYWSSSTYAGDTNSAWFVSIGNNYLSYYDKINPGYVVARS